MRSVFVTGFTGFVGQNLVPYLENNFFNVHGIDLRTTYFGREVNEVYAFIHLAGKAHDLKKITNSDEYYEVNTELTKKVFDQFLRSDSKVFIMMSSVKAAADSIEGELTEEITPSPKTHYGKSKLLAENYILDQPLQPGKRVFILRPCMIHGPGNKGNLNLLFKLAKMKMPWPLGSFENQRSFLSVENLCFVIRELINNGTIPSGIYHVSDDETISTNEIIQIMNKILGYKTSIWQIPKWSINLVSKLGSILHLPLNEERLQKLTESYIVSNKKLKDALGKPLPVSSRDGLSKTIRSFVYA